MNFTTVAIAAHLPSRTPVNLGVLVLDEAGDRIHFRFRTDLDEITDPLDLDAVRGLPGMVESLAAEMGAQAMLLYLEDRASNVIRLSDRFIMHANNAAEAVDRAFAKHSA